MWQGRQGVYWCVHVLERLFINIGHVEFTADFISFCFMLFYVIFQLMLVVFIYKQITHLKYETLMHKQCKCEKKLSQQINNVMNMLSNGHSPNVQ